jgi:hypothetical protein
VTASDPTSGNQLVTTSTSGVAGSGKKITATFSLAMNAATINSTTFTLAPVGGAVLTPASVSYNASTKVATLTTSAALLPNTSYTAIMTVGAVTSAGGVPLACSYAWNFKTVTPAAPGAAAVNLGLATPFAIASAANLSNTGATKINGNVVLYPTGSCNSVTLLFADGPGFGPCAGSPPTHNAGDLVISPVYPDGTTASPIVADLKATFLSIIPSAGFPHGVGSLDGGTPIVAPTTLGTGSTGASSFAPGVYTSNTSIQIWGDLTLNAGGNPDAVFVFQSASTLDTAVGARILLTGGAKASNVWWAVGSSATLLANTVFNGNILADTSITMVTGATSCGRLLAGAFTSSGAFTFDTNTVSVPGHANAPAGCQ